MVRRLALAACILAAPAPALAQSEYGGGWAVPSLDTSLSIGNEIIQREIMLDIVRQEQAGGRAAPAAPRAGTRPAATAAVPSAAAAAGSSASVFASALASQPGSGASPARTAFVRSAAVQRQSQASILARLRERRDPGVGEYERFFRTQDMAAVFDQAAKRFGLRADDTADTLAAYWLTAWIVANQASEFTPAQARAVRAQVAAGLGRTPIAGYPAVKQQQLADEMIFNVLLLSSLHDFAKQGRIGKADYDRLANVTHRSFIGLGADLRRLSLSDSGFRPR